MPTLDVDPQIRALGGGKPLPRGQVTLNYLQAPRRPAVTLVGAGLTFSPTITVQITNGELAAPLAVPATDEHSYAELTIETFDGAGKYSTGPVRIPADAATLADLEPVDPATYTPLPVVPPSAQEVLDQAEDLLRDLRAESLTATPDPDNPDLLILSYPTHMLAADGTSVVIPLETP